VKHELMHLTLSGQIGLIKLHATVGFILMQTSSWEFNYINQAICSTVKTRLFCCHI